MIKKIYGLSFLLVGLNDISTPVVQLQRARQCLTHHILVAWLCRPPCCHCCWRAPASHCTAATSGWTRVPRLCRRSHCRVLLGLTPRQTISLGQVSRVSPSPMNEYIFKLLQCQLLYFFTYQIQMINRYISYPPVQVYFPKLPT